MEISILNYGACSIHVIENSRIATYENNLMASWQEFRDLNPISRISDQRINNVVSIRIYATFVS